MTKPDGERIATLEANYEHLLQTIESQKQAIDEINATVKKLNSVLSFSKGARWGFLAAAFLSGAVGGSALSGIGGILKLPFFIK